jgi:hypothetical protein
MDPLFWVLGGALILGAGAIFLLMKEDTKKKEKADVDTALTSLAEAPVNSTQPIVGEGTTTYASSLKRGPTASMSPVTTRGGKRLRRRRKDGYKYYSGDDIWDDFLYEDCFDYCFDVGVEVIAELSYEALHPDETRVLTELMPTATAIPEDAHRYEPKRSITEDTPTVVTASEPVPREVVVEVESTPEPSNNNFGGGSSSYDSGGGSSSYGGGGSSSPSYGGGGGSSSYDSGGGGSSYGGGGGSSYDSGGGGSSSSSDSGGGGGCD